MDLKILHKIYIKMQPIKYLSTAVSLRASAYICQYQCICDKKISANDMGLPIYININYNISGLKNYNIIKRHEKIHIHTQTSLTENFKS